VLRLFSTRDEQFCDAITELQFSKHKITIEVMITMWFGKHLVLITKFLFITVTGIQDLLSPVNE